MFYLTSEVADIQRVKPLFLYLRDTILEESQTWFSESNYQKHVADFLSNSLMNSINVHLHDILQKHRTKLLKSVVLFLQQTDSKSAKDSLALISKNSLIDIPSSGSLLGLILAKSAANAGKVGIVTGLALLTVSVSELLIISASLASGIGVLAAAISLPIFIYKFNIWSYEAAAISVIRGALAIMRKCVSSIPKDEESLKTFTTKVVSNTKVENESVIDTLLKIPKLYFDSMEETILGQISMAEASDKSDLNQISETMSKILKQQSELENLQT